MIPISRINNQYLGKRKINNRYGQILIVKKKSGNESTSPLDPNLDIEISLKTGTLADLENKYRVKLSTSGVKLPKRAENLLHGMQSKSPSDCLSDLSRYYQFRQLLIARKMSQLVAKTWLTLGQMKSEDKEKFPIIRKLILLSNQPPQIEDDELEALTPTYKPEDESEIILPGRLNWSSAYLNLLLAGQAYLQKEDGTLLLLHESILSTYESANLYAFKLVFDEFVATAQELFSPGAQPSPPYYLWSFPFPPRSNTDASSPLNEEMIEAWAYAEEEGKLPFFSHRDGIEKIEYVYSPYPYMAGSH
jgi:hypothetical protein